MGSTEGQGYTTPGWPPTNPPTSVNPCQTASKPSLSSLGNPTNVNNWPNCTDPTRSTTGHGRPLTLGPCRVYEGFHARVHNLYGMTQCTTVYGSVSLANRCPYCPCFRYRSARFGQECPKYTVGPRRRTVYGSVSPGSYRGQNEANQPDIAKLYGMTQSCTTPNSVRRDSSR